MDGDDLPLPVSQAPAARRRMTVTEQSVPKLARGVMLRFDESRQRWVLLVPERVLAPDEIAIEVLKMCDGVKSVGALIDELAIKYAAPRDVISTDVVTMLQDLAETGFLVEAKGGKK